MVIKKSVKTAIGLMSGTSVDGIDVSLIKSDGKEIFESNLNGYFPYSSEDKKVLKNLINNKSKNIKSIKDAEILITNRHIEAVKEFLNKNGIKKDEVDAIGFHGHTIMHDPDNLITWQIGDSQILASSTGINVVGDFRKRDIAKGGQGAPLVPIYHHALFKDHKRPLVILNIGGVSNITYLKNDDEKEIVACDTCFGNAPMDDLVNQFSGQDYDHNGDIAKNGEINYELAKIILKQDYFKQKPPKSLDRNHFSQLLNDELLNHFSHIKLEDALKTICYIISKSLKDLLMSLDDNLSKEIIVCGGGRHNEALMQTMSDITKIKVTNIDKYGFDGSAIESQAFAFLAIRSIREMPITFRKTTGVLSEKHNVRTSKEECFSSYGGVFYRA